jgi:transposase
MPLPPRFSLSDAEKDALLAQQQDMIERLVARITKLEALVDKPRKTSVNSHIPPSKDGIGRDRKRRKLSGAPRPAQKGKARPLTETPDKTERRIADACGHCGTDVSSTSQRWRHSYDHIGLRALSGHRFTVGIGWPENARCRTLSLAIRATNAPFR